MIRIQLPAPEAERLDALFRSTENRKLRDRLQVVLMAHRGRARQNIAADLGVPRKTVSRWLNASCDAGLDGLQPRKARGQPCKIPADLADQVQRWVIEGPAKQGLDRANWTHEELADHLRKTKGIPTSRSAVQRFCAQIDIRLYRPTYHYERGNPEKQARAKGHRPTVPTRDCKELLDVFAVVNLVSAALHTNTLESPHDAKKKTGQSKTRRLQEAFAAHLRHIGGVYPRERYPRVVLVLDNAPWHRGQPINEALRANPHLEFKRLPSYSPQLNPIERFWKKLRRRATHNRLFDRLADLKASLRSSLRYFQTMRQKVKSILTGRPRRKSNK